MIKFSNVKELNKVLRNQLILQSELNEKRVVNALSIYGETLDKLLEASVFDSYASQDTVLLFELVSRDLNSDVSFTDSNNKIIYNKSYRLKIILYGDSSADVANKLVARFRTQKVRNSLQDLGVYVEKIMEPISLNEFKNGVMWLRNDFSIDISCQFEFSQISDDYDIDRFTKLDIIKNN